MRIFRELELQGKTATVDDNGNYLSVWAKDNAERLLAIARSIGLDVS